MKFLIGQITIKITLVGKNINIEKLFFNTKLIQNQKNLSINNKFIKV